MKFLFYVLSHVCAALERLAFLALLPVTLPLAGAVLLGNFIIKLRLRHEVRPEPAHGHHAKPIPAHG